jgi:hypothetical protein
LKKIIGILIIILFFGTTVLPVIGSINQNVNRENQVYSNNPLSMHGYIKYEGINGESTVSLGLRIIIGNIGDHIMSDIDWTFNAEGGTIIFGDGERGRIPVLNPGEEVDIILRPIPVIFQDSFGQSPIGFGSITLITTAQTSTDILELTEDKLLIGPLFIFV